MTQRCSSAARVALLGMTSVVLAACSTPAPDTTSVLTLSSPPTLNLFSQPGILSVSVPEFIQAARAIQAKVSDVDRLVVTVSASGMADQSQTIKKSTNGGSVSSSSATFNNLPAGTVKLTVVAYDPNGVYLGSISSQPSIVANQTTSVQVNLQLLPTYAPPSGNLGAVITVTDGQQISTPPTSKPTPSGITTFALQTDVVLPATRVGASSLVLGNWVYLIGGQGYGSNGAVLRSAWTADTGATGFIEHPSVSLKTPRRGASAVQVGNWVYVLGGDREAPLNTFTELSAVERASVSGDGTLANFATLGDRSLTQARDYPTGQVIGNYLYVFGGGTKANGANASYERAPINQDGTIGGFSLVVSGSLTTGRVAATSIVSGNWLYVIGGSNGQDLASVERAAINPDGTLGSFSAIAGSALTTPRSHHSSQVVGNYLYVLGGVNGGSSLASVERAAIASDGSIGAFSTVPGVTLTAGRDSLSSQFLGNFLYVLGGQSNQAGLITLERANLLY
jgi:hypothetical protein